MKLIIIISAVLLMGACKSDHKKAENDAVLEKNVVVDTAVRDQTKVNQDR